MSAILDALAAASRDWIGDASSGEMQNAMRAFQSAALQDESLVRESAASLGTLAPGSIALIAVAFGALVERGMSAELTGRAVLDQLRAWLPYLPVPGSDPDESPVPTPDQAMRLARFQFLCQSAVTHLARLPELRETWGGDASLLERLEWLSGYSPGARWVHEALTKTSGTIVLLHPTSVTGLRLGYTNVSNCFHLFSLLQTAVGTRLPGGQPPDEAIACVARGKNSEPVNDRAWWHYGSPLSVTPDTNRTIWGEGLVREIPRVDGEPVMLLWPLVLQRGWDAGFLGPHLEAMPADATVERMLTPDECRAWLARLGVARTDIARPRKRWWPF